MYVYTPPQGHHTPPIPWGGVGTRDTGPYIYIYRWCQNYRTEAGVQKYGKIPYLRTPPDPDSARIRIRSIIKCLRSIIKFIRSIIKFPRSVILFSPIFPTFPIFVL